MKNYKLWRNSRVEILDFLLFLKILILQFIDTSMEYQK